MSWPPPAHQTAIASAYLTLDRHGRHCTRCEIVQSLRGVSFLRSGVVNKVGPNIWNVVNAPKGQVDGFAYSSALLEKGGDWGYESLNGFAWKPKKYINGTKMNYAGLKSCEDRAALIAWLRTLSSSLASLPSQAAIDAEAAAYAAAMGE